MPRWAEAFTALGKADHLKVHREQGLLQLWTLSAFLIIVRLLQVFEIVSSMRGSSGLQYLLTKLEDGM